MNGAAFKGVARLVSDFDPKGHFKFWQDENKWFGTFKIQWVGKIFLFQVQLYVKNVPYKEFSELKQLQKLEGSEDAIKNVYELIDCTELLEENGKVMLEIISKFEETDSIFNNFKKYDTLEVNFSHLDYIYFSELISKGKIGKSSF